MNEMKLSPDDPRLTAYALGELEGGERAAIEAALQTDAVARAAVEEIRATARGIEAALAAEVEVPERARAPRHIEPYLPARKLVRFPYWLVGGLAAAGFAVLLALYRPAIERVAQQKEEVKVALPPAGYVEVPLTAPAPPEGTDQVAKAPGTADGEAAPVASNPAAPAMEGKLAGAPAPREMPALAGAAADHETAAQANEEKDKDLAGAKQTGETAKAMVAAAPEDHEYKYENKLATIAVDAPAAPSQGDRPTEETVKLQSFAVTAEKVDRVESQRIAGGKTVGTFNTEAYAYHADSDFLSAAQNPLSTFALDVDTASYANMRRFLAVGEWPPPDAVRIEELVNYFPYDYAAPRSDTPLAVTLEVAAAPWAPTHRLVRIGLKARDIAAAARPAENLVFLIDVSGSMDEPDKLPLVKQSLRLLLDQLRPDDRVAIVTYAGESGLALPSTPAAHKREILEALDALQAGGATNGARGLELAYDIARANFIPGGANRVILTTDGDFNVGVTDEGDLTRLVEEKARSGVSLTALGFGTGNYKDAMFAQLAGKGHGNYGYIDTPAEAKKLLVDQFGGTLVTVARDVKVQVEFNPAQVSAYRLIGYDDRALKKEDFNNDAVTAGDVGAGHTVTALYEVVPAGVEPPATPAVDALKYRKPEAGDRKSEAGNQKASPELLTVKVRYTPPEGGPSRRLEFPLTDRGAAFAEASMDFKFAAAVAGFGMILRDSPYKGGATLANVEHWAGEGVGADPGGYRHEFLGLVQRAEKLAP